MPLEMQACSEINQKSGIQIPIFGIVTNGSGWQFYRREISGEFFESLPYSVTQASEILGILDMVFAECEKNAL